MPATQAFHQPLCMPVSQTLTPVIGALDKEPGPRQMLTSSESVGEITG